MTLPRFAKALSFFFGCCASCFMRVPPLFLILLCARAWRGKYMTQISPHYLPDALVFPQVGKVAYLDSFFGVLRNGDR